MSEIAARKRDRKRFPDIPWFSVYHGQQCVGHVLCRGQSGYESFDADDASLGLFPSEGEAINAIDRAAE